MTTEREPEVKDVERIEISPAPKDAETIDETEDTDPDSSQEETEGDEVSDEDAKKPDELVKPKPQPAEKDTQVSDDGLSDVDGETPKERAMRLEVTRLKGRLRQEQRDELLGNQPPVVTKKEVSPEKAAILAKYKPEEISSLREVLPALAEEMGFVRKDELQGNTYAEKSQEHLDNFLEKHPEYLPENDKDGTLWNAFKAEFTSGTYNQQPANPKDLSKIFNLIHRDVFGIKPAGALKTVSAQQGKVNSASHSVSSPSAPATSKRSAQPQGMRLDMLKGFDEEEIAELGG